jgi:hypothetical protein
VSSEIAHARAPEEKELNKKLEELRLLETELADRELELATLRGDLQAVEARYMRIVGARYAELDEIEARIAEALAERTSADAPVREQAARARAQAYESARAAHEASWPESREKFKPSGRLKELYREVAKRMHPDLTTDEEERARRNQWMAEANKAYEEGDEARLEEILADWQSRPEAVEGDSVGARLVRVIRKIAQAEGRLAAIESETANLRVSDLFKLKAAIEQAKEEGRDLLAEMASRIDMQIVDARNRLAEVGG